MLTLRLGYLRLRSILMALWVLGSVSSVTMGGGLHIFLVAAIGMMLPRDHLGSEGRQIAHARSFRTVGTILCDTMSR